MGRGEGFPGREVGGRGRSGDFSDVRADFRQVRRISRKRGARLTPRCRPTATAGRRTLEGDSRTLEGPCRTLEGPCRTLEGDCRTPDGDSRTLDNDSMSSIRKMPTVAGRGGGAGGEFARAAQVAPLGGGQHPPGGARSIGRTGSRTSCHSCSSSGCATYGTRSTRRCSRSTGRPRGRRGASGRQGRGGMGRRGWGCEA